MALHVAFQILLKGLLPLSVAGGGIAGLVYQFSPSSDSKSQLDGLEEAFKDVEGPIGDSEFLKEKVKELADTLSKKRVSYNSLKQEVDEANSSKDSLIKDIKDKEGKLVNLKTKTEELQRDKTDKEQKKQEVVNKKAGIAEKNKEIKEKSEAENKKNQSLKASVANTKQTLETKTQELNTKKQQQKEAEVRYETDSAYVQTLVDYEYCSSRWWCLIPILGVKAEHKGKTSEELKQFINGQLTTKAKAFHDKTTFGNEASQIENLKNQEQNKLSVYQKDLADSDKQIEEIKKELTKSDQDLNSVISELNTAEENLKKVSNDLETTNTEQELLFKEIPSSKLKLEETETLITSKSSELEREKLDVERLNKIIENLKAKNPDNQEILSSLEIIETT